MENNNVKILIAELVGEDSAKTAKQIVRVRKDLDKIAKENNLSEAEVKEAKEELQKIFDRIVTPYIRIMEEFKQIEDVAVYKRMPSPLLRSIGTAMWVFNDHRCHDVQSVLRLRKESRKQGLERYSRWTLTASAADFGANVEQQFNMVSAERKILRGHHGFADVPRREEIIKHFDALRDELRPAVAAARRKADAAAIISGNFGNDNSNKVRQVLSRNEAEKLCSSLIKRDGKGASVTLLHFTNDGKVIPSLHVQDYGYLVRSLEEGGQLETCKALKGVNIVSETKRFTRAYVMISVQDMTALSNTIFLTKGKEEWKFRGIYRTIDPAGYDRFWCRVRAADGTELMYDIVLEDGLNETFSFNTWKSTFAVNGYYVYDGSWATSSPGELKNKVMMLPGVYHGPLEGRSFDWNAFFQEGTSGAWQEFAARRDNNNVTFSDVAEFTSRITLLNAYAKYFTLPMRTFGVYAGKIKAKVATGTIPAEHEFMDGMFVYSNEYIAAMIEAEAAAKGELLKVDPDAVVGIGLQSRPFNVKGFGVVTTQEAIANMMAGLGQRIDFFVWNMTEEQVRAWWSLSMNKFKSIPGSANNGGTTCTVNGEEVDLAGKLIVFHWDNESYDNKRNPDCLVDANACKTGFDPTFDAKTKVLAIAHKDSGHNVTSGQMLSGYAASDCDRTEKQLKVIFDNILAETKEDLFKEQGNAPSWADFQGKTVVEIDDTTGEEEKTWYAPRYSEIVDNVAPVLATRYSFAAWRKKVDREVKRISKMVERLNLPVDGTHVTIVPDLGMTFGGGVSVLGCRKDGVTELFSNNPLATTLTKEEYVAKYKTLAAAAGISEEVQQDFVTMVNALSPGMVAVPADEITARANEGWDFDGDSMYLFKMHKGYVEFVGEDGKSHYRWVKDGEEPSGFVTFGHGNRYPKTHAFGYMKVMPECWLEQPVCVRIK